MSEDNALSISTEMSFPLVMKVLSNQIIHKTNVGGIRLNIQNSKDIKSSFKELSKIYKNSNIKKEEQKFLIQRMEFGLAEVILGYRVDDLVGPIVVIGSGGTLSEIYDDKSVRVAPVEIDDAIEMINEVKSLSIINGYRNMPKGDILSLAASVVSISKLAFNKNIKEAEINPLIVKKDKEGVVAVDGLIILKTNN
jgi:succinyl-CoA synthetase beta subunit